jgi:enoyl-CoA hydratase
MGQRMNVFDTIQLNTDARVATITLNQPATMNAISARMRADIDDALRTCETNRDIRVVRFRGTGHAFCSGYDMRDSAIRTYDPRHDISAAEPGEGESRASRDRASLREIADWLARVRRFRKPTVAEVHGYCLSGGLDLIAAMDIVIADASAKFGHPASRGLGIPVTLGYLPQRIGVLKTKEILFTGDLFGAADAERWGLINRWVPDESLAGEVTAFCARTALVPLDSLTVHKDATNRWADLMGASSAVESCMDLNVIAHDSPFFAEFFRRVTEQSLADALEWRDRPFRPPSDA